MKKKTILKCISLGICIFFTSQTFSQKDSLNISEEEKAYFNLEDEDPVEISDEETEYDIIILEPGFNAWLKGIARPEGFYSQQFLENRNNILVIQWNIRVQQPFNFDPQLYQFQIDYSPSIDYGYEVNYKLYNFFIYFQRKYNQRLGPFFPRI
ncbi:DUF6146 family protein [Flagellimonas meridianipacifica]|uniref:Uncharacterized protein n=1 Tax=Flagellimonas meridianipacifica TaxID=1080225 RepID=A0A2T0MC61_9FLAO|nr:DUF6146 family protein [Allomuricauda pacifica]PRX55087.1 hypothetical protein CLV81_3493 [Allomuricauda pacifica]